MSKRDIPKMSFHKGDPPVDICICYTFVDLHTCFAPICSLLSFILSPTYVYYPDLGYLYDTAFSLSTPRLVINSLWRKWVYLPFLLLKLIRLDSFRKQLVILECCGLNFDSFGWEANLFQHNDTQFLISSSIVRLFL